MNIHRVVPNLTIADLPTAVAKHQVALGLNVLINHGWIATLGDDTKHQLSLMTTDTTAPVNPTVSIFVDGMYEALNQVRVAGLEIVQPLTNEPWGVTRFFYRDSSGHVINVGMHNPRHSLLRTS